MAMTKELNLLLPLMEEHAVSNIGGTEFHTGKIHGHNVVLMECGIGKVNAAIGTITLIDTFHPDMVINTVATEHRRGCRCRRECGRDGCHRGYPGGPP